MQSRILSIDISSLRADAALDQELPDRRIGLAVAGDVVEPQQLAVVELDARRALDLREERVDRILHLADFQTLAGERAVLDLVAVEIAKTPCFCLPHVLPARL